MNRNDLLPKKPKISEKMHARGCTETSVGAKASGVGKARGCRGGEWRAVYVQRHADGGGDDGVIDVTGFFGKVLNMLHRDFVFTRG